MTGILPADDRLSFACQRRNGAPLPKELTRNLCQFSVSMEKMWDLLHQALDFVLHLSDRLNELAASHPQQAYALLFLIVFCETGLVFLPFLPGDSLLFAVGAVCAGGGLNLALAATVLASAAFIGDNVNYWVGRLMGDQLARRFPTLVRPQHLARTHQFFEKYGRKTIIFARFVPIVRTFTPFVAGMGTMPYLRFLGSSILATGLWVGLILPAGWFFGNLAPVKKHFELVVVAIIFISALPMIVELVRARRRSSRTA